MDVKQGAELLVAAFETKKRNNGDKFVSLKDGSPEWMTEVIHKVHGDKLPDDTTYAFIKQCAIALSENESEDATDAILAIEPSIYTHELTGWLHARVDHIEYLNEALREIGGFGNNAYATDLLQLAQGTHIREVGYALISALEDVEHT